MKSVLVLPAGIYQLPAVLKAKELGCRVITADNNPQNPGHQYADRAEFVSATDKEKILSLAQDENIDAIFTMASDIALETVAFVTGALGLNKVMKSEHLETIYTKHKFRQFMQDNCFNYPAYSFASSFKEFKLALSVVGFPALLKPSAASGSKGLYYLDDLKYYPHHELEKLFSTAQSYSRNGIVCLEQFIEGRDISGDALIIDGLVVFCEITNKYLTPQPEFVPIGHSVPSTLRDSKKNEIISLLQKAVRALGIKNCGLNFDIILAGDLLYIIEMSPRLGGNCIQNVIKHGTGLDLVESALLVAMGEKPGLKEYVTSPTGVRILGGGHDGVLISHASLSELKRKHPGIMELQFDIMPGAAVKRFTQGAYRIGHVVCKADSVSALENELNTIEEELEITIEGV